MSYQVQIYEPETHAQKVLSWYEARGQTPVPKDILPRLGVVCSNAEGTALAAAWCYLDAGGSGVGFIEWAVSNPGNELSITRQAFAHIFKFLEDECRANDYGILFANIPEELKGFIREASRSGWRLAEERRTCLAKIIEQKGEQWD